MIDAPPLSHISSLLLVTGLSGAGKTTAMNLFADSAYFVIDNLPVPLLPNFLSFSQHASERFVRTALLLDVDSKDSRTEFVAMLASLSPRPHTVQLIFLDADNPTIVRRYSETRRPHPGFDPQRDRSLEDTIQRERKRLQPIKEVSDFVLDTSALNVHALKRELREFLFSLGNTPNRLMRINFLSFGFKYGAPIDCDLLIDVRFLKNPYFQEDLREQTGLDAPVRDFVFALPETGEFIDRYVGLLEFLIPKYRLEGKAYLNIGVGCTGGRHRSVVVAEELAQRFDGSQYHLSAKHRDISR